MSSGKVIPGGGLAALVVAIAIVPALAGCGVAAKGDFTRGKQLFAAKCSQCHALKDAGSTSTIGPNLDAAFAQARAKGMDPDTIAGVVKAQVDNPRPATQNPAVSMPAGLVTGQNLDDVATYIGTVAGNPKFKGPQIPNLPGAQVFVQNNCAGCHTLQAAGASGTVGPDLDQAIPKLSQAQVKQSIVAPNAKIAPGYPSNVMPQNFKQLISAPDLNALVKFLIQCSGKGATTPACQPKSGGGSSK